MSSGVPLIGDPDASRKMEHTNTNINLTLSVFYFSLSFFLSLSTLWPRPQGINSRNCNMFISLDLPDEGFTINRKLAERCSSFTPNPFPDVISQHYISQTPEEWIKSLPRTVYGSTWRDSSLHSTSLQVLIPPSRTWGGDGAPRTTSLR